MSTSNRTRTRSAKNDSISEIRIAKTRTVPDEKTPNGCSDAEYRAIFNCNPHPTWVYQVDTLTITDVNDAALKQYGYTRDEFIGMSIADLRPPEEAAKFARHMSRKLPDGRPGVWRHRKKNGTVFHAEVCGTTLKGAAAGRRLVSAIDISARSKAEAALRASEERNRTLICSIPQRVFLKD